MCVCVCVCMCVSVYIYVRMHAERFMISAQKSTSKGILPENLVIHE